MVEGDKGNVKTEDKRQQRDLVKTARHKGKPGGQKADPGGLGDDHRCQKVGGENDRRVGAGILQIAKQFAKRHLREARADGAADGKLCQNDELIDPWQVGPSHQMAQCRQPDRPDKMWHRNAKPARDQHADNAKQNEGDDVHGRQIGDAWHRLQRDIRLVDGLLSFDQAQQQRRRDKDKDNPHQMEQRDNIVAVNHLAGHGDGLGLAARHAAQNGKARVISAEPAQELIAD